MVASQLKLDGIEFFVVFVGGLTKKISESGNSCPVLCSVRICCRKDHFFGAGIGPKRWALFLTLISMLSSFPTINYHYHRHHHVTKSRRENRFAEMMKKKSKEVLSSTSEVIVLNRRCSL